MESNLILKLVTIDRGDREIRTQFFNPRFSGFNNTFWGNPSFPLFYQPHLFGFGNNATLPFHPQTPSRFRPQTTTSSPEIRTTEPRSPGKFGWSNPSVGNNSNSGSTPQSGSRYFSENSGSTPSSPRSSGNGGTRSGRRN